MFAFLTSVLPALVPVHALARAQEQRPDVVVFLIDDVADSDIDDIVTPTLDSLAARGVRFRRAYSHAWCAPTRDSLLRSTWLGVDHGDSCAPPTASTLDFRALTLAKVFEGQGYRTVTLGKWHLGNNAIGPWEMTPHLMGFDSVRATIPVGDCDDTPLGWVRLDDGIVTPGQGDRTLVLREALVDWWTSRESPRFAMVNLTAAHSPFTFPPRAALPAGYPRPRFPTNRQAYEAEVVSADFVLGQLLPVLGPDTWIIFLGDNGTPGLVPGEPAADTVATRPDQQPGRVKLTCYEDGVRIPLIVSGPGTARGLESHALVHVVDLLPTLAEIIGVKLRAPVDGLSFARALTGGPGQREFVFVHSAPRVDNAVIQERWKLLTNPQGVEELYDLESDPRERHPLPPIGPIAQKLRVQRASILPSTFRPLFPAMLRSGQGQGGPTHPGD